MPLSGLVLPAFLQKPKVASSAPARPAKAHRRVVLRVERQGLLVFSPNAPHAARIAWHKPDTVSMVEDWAEQAGDGEVECTAEGLLGLLKLFEHSWLLAISRTSFSATLPTEEQGQVRQLDDVLAIPLEKEAATAIIKQRAAKTTAAEESDASFSASDADEAPLRDYLGQRRPSLPADPTESKLSDKRNSIFGLGAYFRRPMPSRQRDLSALAGKKQDLDDGSHTARPSLLSHVSQGAAHTSLSDIARSASIPLKGADQEASLEETPSAELLERLNDDKLAREHLDAKIVKELIASLRHGIFLSYEAPITRSLQYKATRQKELGGYPLTEPDADKPLLEREDKRFVYNRHLSRPFVKAGLVDYIVPIMQGFVRQEAITLPGDSHSFELTMTVMSRRSVERPGLRYMRRGINENGATSNFVETEWIIELDSDKEERKVSSFVQIRGSIPLFWSQSPWSLKPVPVLERSDKENEAGFAAHFGALVKLYGPQEILNVAEGHGKEGIIVSAYGRAAEKLARSDVHYTHWDFHHECKGMRFENVSRLVDQVLPDMERMGFFVATPAAVQSTQNGTFRTNCMDCLDRTNVVQSALARKQLSLFLAKEQLGSVPYEQLELLFNDTWASNGDAISREYAGTSALKGDFVRTGKRNLRGMVNDATNSLARMWNNTILDFFKQSVIDYSLGINLGAFEEYQERVTSSDPGELLRLAQIRSTAIDTAASHVLAPESEKLVSGWTLLSPLEADRRLGPTFEEKVLLLSNKAIYVCRYEYHLQKVIEFTRIPLGDIVGIVHGPYIISTLSSFARDEKENYGLVITYQSGSTEERTAAYSVGNQLSLPSPSLEPSRFPSPLPSPPDAIEVPFKVMRRDLVAQGDEAGLDTIRSKGPSAATTAQTIAKALHSACREAGAVGSGAADGFVRQETIVSFEEAENNTGLFARLKHQLNHAIFL